MTDDEFMNDFCNPQKNIWWAADEFLKKPQRSQSSR